MRYGAADPRLIDEIGFAGGHTAGATDALMDFWHHNARVIPGDFHCDTPVHAEAPRVL